MTTARPVDYREKWNQICLAELVRIGDGFEDEPKWASGDTLAWRVFDSTECIRGRARACLRQLADDGLLELFVVRHRDAFMDCYLLDAEALKRVRQLLLEGLDQRAAEQRPESGAE
jgi:hypothetical protein